MFEKATRLKLRFASSKGNLSVEDLWDLPLFGKSVNLDDIYKDLDIKLKNAPSRSLVFKNDSVDDVLQLKFDIVSHVITTRLAEIDQKKSAKEKAAKKKRILALIAKKQDDAVGDLSIEELTKMAEEL